MKLPIPTRLKDRIRPVYHAALTAINPHGNLVTMNGKDAIRLSASLRRPSGQHEPDVWNRLMDAVRSGDTCVDIGASVGLYTLGFANRLHGRGRVFSFEPDFASYQILQRNIVLNDFSGIVCSMNIAISDANGVLSFMDGLGPTSHAAGPAEKARCVSVASFSLDTIFGETGIAPNVIKIDTEGFELQVLKEAATTLSRPIRPRLIYIDVHPWAWAGLGLHTTEKALRDLLNTFGYEVQKRNDEYADIFAVSA